MANNMPTSIPQTTPQIRKAKRETVLLATQQRGIRNIRTLSVCNTLLTIGIVLITIIVVFTLFAPIIDRQIKRSAILSVALLLPILLEIKTSFVEKRLATERLQLALTEACLEEYYNYNFDN